MSAVESTSIADILDVLRTWPSSERLRRARLILDTIETHAVSTPSPSGSLMDLLGILKTDGPPPNDKECRAILEEELTKKHLQ